MLFFHRRKQREAQVEAIQKDAFKKIDKANKSADKLNTLLKDDIGVTEMIFLATGGGKRNAK